MQAECYCTVVILNWNKRALLRRSLEVLRDVASLPYRVEIVVVDNGSTDGSREMVRREFPAARLIENPRNLGIAQGKNVGLRAARGEFVLLLDDDTTIHPAQLAALIDTARAHPKAGIVSCMKVRETGAPLYEYHVPSPSTLGLGFFVVTELSLIEVARAIKRLLRLGAPVPHETRPLVEIPYIGGGIMLVRMRAIAEVGLMDGNIFFYGEDFDWCYRFRQRGWKILYMPQIRVISAHGVNAVRTKRASLVALRSRRYLFEKYLGKRYLPIYAMVALAGLLPKLAHYGLQRLRGGGRQDISTWEWFRGALQCIAGRESGPLEPLISGQGHAH
jgi:GT2 family glycosyltransferase